MFYLFGDRPLGPQAVADLDFEAVEIAARRLALRLAARALEQRLNADTSDHAGPELPCSCGEPARYRGRHAKTLESVLGPLRLERAYYFRQPGANIITTVDAIMAAIPSLQATIKRGEHLMTILDRTLTIRASVSDIETTLLISVVLVIAVVFVFLRNVRATLIPAVAVPVSLIGTCAVMYLFGFSLDNLSLMALAIASGFVVDDAIVVMEISRGIWKKASPPLRRRSRAPRKSASPSSPSASRSLPCSFRCCSWAASSAGFSASSPLHFRARLWSPCSSR